MKWFAGMGLALMVFLAGCGGGGNAATEAPPAAPTAVETDSSGGEAASSGTNSSPTVAPTKAPAEPTDAPTAEAEEAIGDVPLVAGRPASGIDTETGLEINPDVLIQGSEFIVRGRIITMNLTPQTDPEFVIEAPSGTRYRVHSQGLQDIYLEDGSQLQPFQYQIGQLAQATVFQETSAGVTTVVETTDLLLLQEP